MGNSPHGIKNSTNTPTKIPSQSHVCRYLPVTQETVMDSVTFSVEALTAGSLTISWGNRGQTACIWSRTNHARGYGQSRSFCVLEEAGVRFSLFEAGEAVYRDRHLKEKTHRVWGPSPKNRCFKCKTVRAQCVLHEATRPYTSYLPQADVVQVQVLDAEALLCLVETPQPLAVHRSSLALPSLATPTNEEC